MRLDAQATGHSAPSRYFSLPVRCPHCGDYLVAPVASEFVDDGEIRHHWSCDTCGGHSLTSVSLLSAH
ncbi:MAG: hypothetical protein WA792_10560 [Pseudolabrys sp.]|jgi:transcription elongation factor Elf1